MLLALNDYMYFILIFYNVLHNRGQCYDGASAMSGQKGGVAKLIRDLEPRALYTHCYGHALNLAAQDALRQNGLMNDALDFSIEIIKLVKVSVS